jgi:hypothetical protein
METYGLHNAKTPRPSAGSAQSTRSRKGDYLMVNLMLFVFLILLLVRKRRAKLKIDIDL